MLELEVVVDAVRDWVEFRLVVVVMEAVGGTLEEVVAIQLWHVFFCDSSATSPTTPTTRIRTATIAMREFAIPLLRALMSSRSFERSFL